MPPVCFPYEFTLLSNLIPAYIHSTEVCFPYEFTLLSNHPEEFDDAGVVCFPYEFTLLSNLVSCWIAFVYGLFSLRIYTALKPANSPSRPNASLFSLRIYTALKLNRTRNTLIPVCFPYEFTLLSNFFINITFHILFVFPTNLHCSQTARFRSLALSSLFSLRIYTALKPQIVQE